MTDNETEKDFFDVPLADAVRELELAEFECVHGVTCDARGNVWFAHGAGGLACVEPEHGRVLASYGDLQANAGTAYDGSHVWQITGDRIARIDPETGEVERSIPLPHPGGGEYSGMAWADGVLWVGRYRGKQLCKLDAETGAVLKTIDVDRFVTGVTWIDGELWHGAWERADEKQPGSELRRVDPDSGRVEVRLRMPDGFAVSGVGADRAGRLWCGGSAGGGLCAVRRP